MRALFYVEQNYGYAILRPLQQEILSRGGEVRWFLVGDEIDSSYRVASAIQLNAVPEVGHWRPDVVFAPGNRGSRAIPGLKVCVFHGFAAGKTYGGKEEAHFTTRPCFDLYCTHGPSNTKRFRELADEYGSFEVFETGWPVLDPLFIPLANKRPMVLFCSTFSRRYSCA